MGWMEFKIHLLQADRVSQARRLFTKQAEGQKALEGAHKVEWPSLMEDMQPKWGRRCTSATPTSCTSHPCTASTARDAVELPLLQDKVHPPPPEQQQFCSTSKMQLGVAGTEGGLYPDEKSVEICRLQRITIGHLRCKEHCNQMFSCARHTLHLHNQGVIQIAE